MDLDDFCQMLMDFAGLSKSLGSRARRIHGPQNLRGNRSMPGQSRTRRRARRSSVGLRSSPPGRGASLGNLHPLSNLRNKLWASFGRFFNKNNIFVVFGNPGVYF